MLLTDKYAPKKLDDLLGNDEARARVRQWVLNWIAGKKQRPLLLYGPAGVGKTSSACALAKEFQLDLIEMNASELRNKTRIEKVLHGATMAGSLTGNGKLLLIDDADAFQGRKDFGGAGAVAKMLAECACPIIVTATDVWDKGFASIRSECELLEMKKVSKPAIRRLLGKITDAEKLPASAELLEKISDNCAGDVRSALNDLQALNVGVRDREKDVFNLIRLIFKAKDIAEARDATRGDIDYESIKLWIDENIPNEYTRAPDLALAYHYLSRSDIFEGRIRKSNWKYLKYSIDLGTIGVSMAKAEPYRVFTKYSFPNYLREMSRSMARRAMLKAIGLKIGSHVHANRREALEYLPLLREMGAKSQDAVAVRYGFDEEEIAFIMETSPGKVRSRAHSVSI
jgi:replication factor C large subunit